MLKKDYTETVYLSSMHKCTAAIRRIAYGTSRDAKYE
jgi:hypothetical protein